LLVACAQILFVGIAGKRDYQLEPPEMQHIPMLQGIQLGRKKPLSVDESAIGAGEVFYERTCGRKVYAGVASRHPVPRSAVWCQIDMWLNIVFVIAPAKIRDRCGGQGYFSAAFNHYQVRGLGFRVTVKGCHFCEKRQNISFQRRLREL
jgi:hypothetical protein